MKSIIVALLAVICLAVSVTADLPVHCLHHQVRGTWTLSLTRDGESKDVVQVCTLESQLEDIQRKVVVTLDTPDIIRDENGKNVGHWTLIYDQGMELVFEGRKFFAFFRYTKNGDEVTSHCDQTFTGWYHTAVTKSDNWGCFKASKNQNTFDSIISTKNVHKLPKLSPSSNEYFKNNMDMIEKINGANLGWKATAYPQFEGKTIAEMQRMAGGQLVDHKKVASMKSFSKLMNALNEKNTGTKTSTVNLPLNLDWRNVSGVNFVSPVRNQGSCGSCYSFATLGMFESRVRILTQNKKQPYLSNQDIVSCCAYSQGCDGGFPFLVAKYAQDFGLTTEECDPYVGRDTKCANKCTTDRLYVSQYQYVGGYYGGTNEQSMMEELYRGGPVAIGIMVYSDFFNYRSGIYKHGNGNGQFDDPRFVEVNHAVLLVGYGETPEGVKYWICKNSWGSGWGDNGYFKIIRGIDNCGIESLAVAGTPVV